MAPPSPSSDEFAIGSLLDGRYRIDAVLGTGGMGRVYRAEHTKIGKPVAIKVLHADLHRNREASQRFQREAIASGRLDHPNIVGVSDFGVLDGGTCYLVMEVLEGESLGDRLARERRIHWVEAIEILRGVLHGLRHAHERGVVHRDIKPDNVYLARKDGDPVIKILDFGIAKLYAGSSDDPASTRAGLTVGTPAYLSPEQACGGEITPRSDLYSASIVLYEMLAGRAPFEDRDPLAMLGAHVSRRPPAFSVIAAGVDIPARLEEIIQHGLRKSPGERIGTAADYLALLDAFSPPLAPMPRAATPLELEVASARIKIPPSLKAATRDPVPPKSDALQSAWEAARGRSVIGAPSLGPAAGTASSNPAGTESTANAATAGARAGAASAADPATAGPHLPGVASAATAATAGPRLPGVASAATAATAGPRLPGVASAANAATAGPRLPGVASAANAATAGTRPAGTASAASSDPGGAPAMSASDAGAWPAMTSSAPGVSSSGTGASSSDTARTTGAAVPGTPGAPSTPVSLEMAPLPRAIRAVSLAEVGEPIPLTWIVRSGVVIGLVIVAAIVLAIAARCSGSSSSPRPTARATVGAQASPGSSAASDRAAPAPTRPPPATAPGASRAPDREAQYRQLVRDLDTGKTCADRRTAIAKLVDLADHRAVGALHRATSRSGPGDEGNGCLKVDAERAIKSLEALK
jgi:serine/threonine-protein kinase